MKNSKQNLLLTELEIWKRITKQLPQIAYAGDTVLRKPCRLVTEDDFTSGRVHTWCRFIEKTLKRYREIAGYGRGLAANQVGIDKQIIITYVNDEFQTYINPVVVGESEGKAVYGELCLSFGLVMGDIVRPLEITVEYLDETGRRKVEHAGGIVSRLLQHEIAHLRGRLCLDEAMPTSLRIIRQGKEEVFNQKLKIIREVKVEI